MRRAARAGGRRCPYLTEGPHKGQHIAPEALRVIQEWNGDEWETVCVAERLGRG
ncbi:DUF6087 family protein [Streptomyces decoyicus]|uniref:DUF6087 family protein n=1 Tax=Streptomyces decoyicus TaxID=249567 RepID=UPI003C12C2D1